jgi:hypothetical protein
MNRKEVARKNLDIEFRTDQKRISRHSELGEELK